ncbi:MAG: hypothetical protein WA705_27095 [Candidatus Ozemobacteraceae bacterium]
MPNPFRTIHRFFTSLFPENTSGIWKVLSAAYFLAFLFLAFRAIWGDTPGFDIWFHLRNGWAILNTGSVPHLDASLPTLSKLPEWYFPNYEWLFGITAFAAYKIANISGIEILRLGLIFLAFGITFFSMTRSRAEEKAGGEKDSPHPCFFLFLAALLFLAFAAATRRFEPRPHLISAVGLALISLTLLRRPSNLLVLCCGFFLLLWANCHIELLFGLGLLILLALRNLIFARYLSPVSAPPHSFSPFVPAILFAAGIVALLLSPASWRVFTQGADYYARQSMINAQFGFGVNELVPLEATWWRGPYGLFLAIWAIVFLASPHRKEALVESLPALPFALLPFLSNRHILPAVIVSAPIIAAISRPFFCILHHQDDTLRQRIPVARSQGNILHRIILIVISLLFPLFIFMYHENIANPQPSRPKLEIGDAPYLPWSPDNHFPEQSLRYLAQNNLGGTIFTLDRWGSFLTAFGQLETASPARRPFIHVMGQAFPARLLEDYLRMLVEPDSRQNIITFYGIDLFLLPLREAPYFRNLADWLQASPDWRLLTWDDTACIYARKIPVLQSDSTTSTASSTPSSASTAVASSAAFLSTVHAVHPVAFTLEESFLRTAADSDDLLNALRYHSKTSHGERSLNTFLWLGTILELRGIHDEAIEALRKAVVLNPEAFPSLLRLGGLLGKTGAQEEASRLLSRACRVCPAGSAHHYNLAVAFKKNGQINDCLRELTSVLAREPSFKPAQNLFNELNSQP